MIEKKSDLIKVVNMYYKVWNSKMSWKDKELYYESGGRIRGTVIDLDKDTNFLISLVQLLNTLPHLTKEEKEQIVRGGRNWLYRNIILLCSVLNYTEQEIKDLTALEIQGMVADVMHIGSNSSDVVADVLKKLYKERQTETVEAIKIHIQNEFLGLGLLDIQRGKYSPPRIAKQMIGKQFCDEMGIGWIKEGGEWKTLEQELKEM